MFNRQTTLFTFHIFATQQGHSNPIGQVARIYTIGATLYAPMTMDGEFITDRLFKTKGAAIRKVCEWDATL